MLRPVCFREQICRMWTLRTSTRLRNRRYGDSFLQATLNSSGYSLKDFTHGCSIMFLPPDHQPGFSVPVKFLACSDTDQSVKPRLQAGIEPTVSIASRQVQLLGSRHRWTCVIMHRKPRDRCSSVIFIKQLITMHANACVPMYVNLCESYASESFFFLYTHFILLTLGKVSIVCTIFYIIIRRFISMRGKW